MEKCRGVTRRIMCFKGNRERGRKGREREREKERGRENAVGIAKKPCAALLLAMAP
jgi:hypothetical protein